MSTTTSQTKNELVITSASKSKLFQVDQIKQTLAVHVELFSFHNQQFLTTTSKMLP